MYKIQEKNRPESAHWLNNSETTIGNTPAADIPLRANIRDDVTVTILSRINDILLQNTSNAAVTLNGKDLQQAEKIQPGDEFTIAGVSFELLHAKPSNIDDKATESNEKVTTDKIQYDQRYWQLLSIDTELSGRYFKLGALTIIGRDEECNICIPNEQLSRRHMQLVVTGGKVMMQDLNSTNGCFINDTKSDHSILEGGELLRIGNMTFRLVPPAETSSQLKNSVKIDNTASIPDVKVDISSNADKLNQTQKNWVTKPTSIGNREDDSIDILLEKHMRSKRIMRLIYVSATLATAAAAFWFFALK